jgi:hypothetical protein
MHGLVKIILLMKLIISNEEEGLIYFAMSYYSSGECKVYIMREVYEVGTDRSTKSCSEF